MAARYGVLKRDAGIALRGLYLINPEGVLEHITMNNFPIGRNVDEAKRILQACDRRGWFPLCPGRTAERRDGRRCAGKCDAGPDKGSLVLLHP